MNITYMRINGKKPALFQLESIMSDLRAEFIKQGFETEVNAKNSTAIKIGGGGKCFTVNVEQLGHNASVGFSNHAGYFLDNTGIKGYKRTSIPTWAQRVEFNNIINKILDAYEVTANIKSGPYTIRHKDFGGYSEGDWYDQTPYESYSYAIDRIVELTPEMISEGKEKLKEHRAEQKRLKKEALVRNLTELQGKSKDEPLFI